MLHWFAKRLREMQEVRRDERGFTLIELLVVVIIIGILAAIAIPVFLSQRERAVEGKVKSDVRNAVTAYETAYAEDDAYPAAGTYTTAAPIQNAAGDTIMTPSEDVTLVTTVSASGDSFTITGTAPGTGFTSFAFDSSTGQYTTT